VNSPLLTIISCLAIITVIVVSHEFGHFIIAKINGIRVSEFTIGVGPAIFRKKGKVTDFVIRILPFGGACIFAGLDGEPVEDSDGFGKGFRDAPVWSRIATVLAGPFFNILLALLLAAPLVWTYGADEPVIAAITEGLPAEAAGMQAGDEILKVDGHRVHLWREIMIRSMMNEGQDVEIVYRHDGQTYTVTITPAWSEADGRYFIGFAGGSYDIDCRNLKLIPYSWFEVRYWLDATIQGLKYMVNGHMSLDNLAGPVGVANVVDDTIEETVQYGWFTVFMNMLNLAVLLSVNLGIMNLLPVPALDGGKMLFLIYEVVSGKKLPPEKEGLINMIGIVLLVILMVVVLFNDVSRFFR